MKRTYLQLWLTSVFLFLSGMVAQESISQLLFSDDEVAWLESSVRGGALCAAELWQRGPQTPEHLERLSQDFGFPVEELQTRPAPSYPSDYDERIHWHFVDDEWLLLVTLDGPFPRYLAVGPMPNYPIPWLTPRVALACVVATGLAALFWLTLAPLDRAQRALTQSAREFAAGHLESRISERGPPAAREMIAAFNTMAERIQALLRSQREVLRSASHELKTPIARLRIGLHLMAAEDSGQQRELRESALDGDLQELDALVDEILLYSRLESGVTELKRQTVGLATIADKLRDKSLEHASGARIELSDNLASLEVEGELRLLERALRNLLANALRHAHSRVRVEGQRLEHTIELHIDDDGPGLDEGQRLKAHLPFVRFDEAATGHGLGLAIVTRIMELHGGRTHLEAAPLGGLRVRLVFPRAGH